MTTPTNEDGTTSSRNQVPPASPARVESGSGPLLTSHAALILLAAVVVGGVVAALTYLSAGNGAAAALAGLMGAGASIPVLHTMIGL
ncbi:hypothetical protein ACFWB3_10530 [[Kitasatospora] papulosa]|uniref:hypothetical protein n=1 Tax=[Kitasatospora] papulosa TaxID=1464011 RepID=UPI00368534D5